MMPTPVILLKEGTDTSQGIPQLVSNISACQVIAEAVRTTLGPRGMDKLIVDDRGKTTISNDGATILKLLDVVHPAAKTLVDIAKSQDAEFWPLVLKRVNHPCPVPNLVHDLHQGFLWGPLVVDDPSLLPLVPQDYQAIVDAEWNILYDKLEKLHKSGAKVILSKLPIGDVATQYFADRDMFCAGRVPEEDLKRTMMACGGSIQSSANALTDNVLGRCLLFEEAQIGGERYNFFTGCPKAKTCTIILRGGAQQFMDETERSLHDAIMIVRRAIKNDSVVGGGGAIEMEISKYLRDYSRTIPGKQQLLIGAYAKALEIIPRQLCDNAGFDATNILNKLRAKHAQGGTWYGVDVNNEDIADNFDACVWEPAVVRINALTAASEAACLIISVDETIKNPRSTVDAPPMGRGRGRPHTH
ncbi:PREDICTED: T-complex protein 1 subunit eta [Thamnophis sirtalis]|uniref:CCT-eta n=1 Tax=Thamnophis sirtalis TaxID=35019 RepID=A0A6I9X7R0_9SAUR|nr:PREDICTED: T-complex protein 1 subunit eta [Thamnophis sirtalis]